MKSIFIFKIWPAKIKEYPPESRTPEKPYAQSGFYKDRFKLSRNNMKLILLTSFTVMLTLFCLSACSTFPSESQSNFHLKVYEEAESLSIGDSQKKNCHIIYQPFGVL